MKKISNPIGIIVLASKSLIKNHIKSSNLCLKWLLSWNYKHSQEACGICFSFIIICHLLSYLLSSPHSDPHKISALRMRIWNLESLYKLLKVTKLVGGDSDSDAESDFTLYKLRGVGLQRVDPHGHSFWPTWLVLEDFSRPGHQQLHPCSLPDTENFRISS